MGFLSWILLGLVVGALAKFLLPGDDPDGLFVTIGIGVAGAVVGGFLASAVGMGEVTGFDLRSVAIAVGGSMLLLLGWRRFRKA